MGYYTLYSLKVRNVKTEEDFSLLIQKIKAYDLIGYVFDPGHYNSDKKEALFGPYDTQKWYNHADDMRMISKDFWDMMFELTGNGEEREDIWKEYYHDGEVEHCDGIITYEKPMKIQWAS